MQANKISILIFGMLIICSCNSKKNKQRTPSEMLIDWKNDSLGCLRVRNDSSFKLITDSIKIIGKSYNEALLMFGKPNKIYKTKDGAVISYFLNTRCGGTLTETECFARFDFENDTLYSFGIMCP